MSEEMISVNTIVDTTPTGGQYLTEFNGKGVKDPTRHSSKVFWRSRDSSGVKEELFVHGRFVVLSRYTEISNSFPSLVLTFDTPVVDAFHCSFHIPFRHFSDEDQPNMTRNIAGRIQQGITVFESERLTFIDQSGEQYAARLPCRVSRAWPMDTTILLERRPNKDEAVKNKIPSVCEAFATHSTSLFTLFSLNHPLDEAAPILLKVPLPGKGFGICFASDINLKILTVLPSLNLVLTRHLTTGQHSLWLLEKAAAEDYAMLYQIEPDGYASVAPHALSGFIHPSGDTSRVHSVTKTPGSFAMPQNTSKSSVGCSTAHLCSPTVCDSPAKPFCLSPFAASLSRLTESKTQERTPNQNQLRSLTTDLATHMSRLSSITPTRLNSSTTGNLVTSARRSSISTFQPCNSSATPNPTGLANLYPKLSYLSAAGARALPLRTILYNPLGCDSVFHASGPKATANEDVTEDLIGEPLLPKICMRLVWAETVSSGSVNPRTVTNVSTPIRAEISRNMLVVPDSTPTGINFGDELPAAARFTIISRRLLDPPSSPANFMRTASPILQTPGPIHAASPCVWAGQQIEEEDACSDSKLCGPIKSRAFLATDFSYASWICFLTADSKSRRLACLQIKPSSDQTTAPEFGRLTYLRAHDSVYVPSSHLTVCLEIGTGIVVYSGIKRVCIIGSSPIPIKSPYSAICQSSVLQKKLSDDIQIPFVLRPGPFDKECWHRNTVSQLLKKAHTVIKTVLDSYTDQIHRITDMNYPDMFELLSIRSCDTVNSHISSGTGRTNTHVVENFELGDPAGDSFILINKSNLSNPNQLPNDRFLRVYMPAVATNELVQLCLRGLTQSLPSDVSLTLLTHWYVVANAPGSYQDPIFDESCKFSGSAEWSRFAKFMLTATGLSFTCDNSNDQTVDCDYDHLGRAVNNVNKPYPKRQRSADEDPTASDWDTMLHTLGIAKQNDLDPSLLNLPSQYDPSLCTESSVVSKRVLVLSSLRKDPDSRIVYPHLPSILIVLHLVYEEAKLNCILTPELICLAELNLVLSRVLKLSAFIEYYEAECPESIEYDDSLCPIPLQDMIWPVSMPTSVPCLIDWITQQLESFDETQSNGKTLSNETSYFYLPGVNDLAVTLSGMIISTLSSYWIQQIRGLDESKATDILMNFWHKKIICLDFRESVEFEDRQQNFTINQVVQLDRSQNRYAMAFAKTLISAASLSHFDQLQYSRDDHVQSSVTRKFAQHLSLLFLSRLHEDKPDSRDRLNSRLKTLPPGFLMLLRILLSRCKSDPPPNCGMHVYSLMGRDDLAKQLEMSLSHAQRCDTSKPIGSGSSQQVESYQNRNHSCSSSSSWTLAESWANLIRPPRDPPSSASDLLATPHSLLYHLENNAACQVAFQDDLRLREAYRLLQGYSHIRLPRLNVEEMNSNSGPNGSSTDSTGRVTEARLEMHLAAAGIRVWASAIGRGMLGLGSLVGSKVPTQIRVPSICLRGRAISPTSGRLVLVDLARESLNAFTTGGMTRTTGQTDLTTNGLDLNGSGHDRRTIGNSTNADTGQNSTEFSDASNHPGNFMALAIASAVAFNGAGASLRTISLDLPRMLFKGSTLNTALPTVALNAASSTASLLSTANLQQAPSVLAAKHWPSFHNGVAVGLTISPHASVDATWIMYNCRSAGSTSSVRRNTRPNSDPASNPSDLPTPEQAGLLLGLGLNGHLNKITSYDIGEYLIRVHDLHNMAVLLGLCAGKRGTMDQSVLRLIAVHYRPLLPCDPLVQVNLTVPNLCQAAAVFGLGLLYQGSAHRHITNLLIEELGRPLSGDTSHAAARKGICSDSEVPQTGSNATLNTPNNNTNGWTGAGGTGGFAGDSCELMALSAGLALGLVLLQRGDSPCGLSDLQWAEKLHAYMIGGPRTVHSSNVRKRNHWPGASPHEIPEVNLQRTPSRSFSRRPVDGSRRTRPPSSFDNTLSDSPVRAGNLWSTHLFLDEGFSTDVTLGHERTLLGDHVYTPTESRALNSTDRSSSLRIRNPTAAHGTSISPMLSRTMDRVSSAIPDISSRADDRQIRMTWKNPQIRDLDRYNMDVSAPGAIIALGLAFLGSGNSTVSSWMIPPSSLRLLELVRPDLLLFQALVHGLINWNTIEPDNQWLISFIPQTFIEQLQTYFSNTVRSHAFDLTDLRTTLAPTDLSSEDDVENRCPDLPLANTLQIMSTRSETFRRRRSGISSSRGSRSVRRTRAHGTELVNPTDETVEDPFKVNGIPLTSMGLIGLSHTDPIDLEAICLAYLNMLIGRALAMGLRFAGTCHPGAAQTLYDLVQSILDRSWWPPFKIANTTEFPNEIFHVTLPKPVIIQAAAHCLLALAMILAGSGNLTVLRLVRQLRAIRLFRSETDVPNRKEDVLIQPRLHIVAAAAARAAAATQASSSSSSGGSLGGPVSVAAVFGAALGPAFGLQMLYGTIIGLLFLGGGRLTLSNSPEAAAMLVVSFFPTLPTYAGDNWYHLQALRHLYALATIPRRMCAVDVDTGRVVLSNMFGKFRDSNESIESEGTFIFPSGIWDKLAWLELNHKSEEYWPTIFYNGTNNWNAIKKAFDKAGYIYTKRKDSSQETTILQSWLDNLFKHWHDIRVLKQLKLMVCFLRRFPSTDNQSNSCFDSSNFDFGRELASRVTQQFVQHKHDLSKILRAYYLDTNNLSLSENYGLIQINLLKAFQIWFTIPNRNLIGPYLPKDSSPTLPQFLSSLRSGYPNIPPANLLWLYRFLYPSCMDIRPLACTV